MELNQIPQSSSSPVAMTPVPGQTETTPVTATATRISCCYGFFVFLGLAISLVTLTLLVIYAGVWSHMSIYDDHLVFVAGGEHQGSALADIEVLPLPASEKEPRCRTVPELPMGTSGAIGTVLKKRITVCGGKDHQSDSVSAQCLRLTGNYGWMRFATMTKARAFAAAVIVPDLGWWITGGLNKEEPMGITTTELYGNGDAFEDLDDDEDHFIYGPALPEGVSHHCLIRVNASKFVLIGGRTKETEYSNKVWQYDWARRRWSSAGSLKYGRNSHSCALVNKGNYVVVAGGLTDESSYGVGGTRLAEMLEVSTGHWHIMPELPRAVFGAIAAKLEPIAAHGSGELALIGGSEEDKRLLYFVRRGQFEDSDTYKQTLDVNRRYPLIIVASPRIICF